MLKKLTVAFVLVQLCVLSASSQLPTNEATLKKMLLEIKDQQKKIMQPQLKWRLKKAGLFHLLLKMAM